jgi:hypothetical protein
MHVGIFHTLRPILDMFVCFYIYFSSSCHACESRTAFSSARVSEPSRGKRTGLSTSLPTHLPPAVRWWPCLTIACHVQHRDLLHACWLDVNAGFGQRVCEHEYLDAQSHPTPAGSTPTHLARKPVLLTVKALTAVVCLAAPMCNGIRDVFCLWPRPPIRDVCCWCA